ncbi:MAG TPA: hypothetical protein VKS98_02510 [Chthoniobacterales bacterium]|nr:hypothetical protein [Chthoniobacterales bacterium]
MKLSIIVPAVFTALLIPAASHAAVCSVPSGSYPTIQSAANDPTCTQINVAAGPYSENVVVNYSTTINGAQAGNSFSGRTSGGPAESTVQGLNPIGSNPVFTIKAANVVIDGFTIKNSITTGAAVGIDVKVSGNGALITNNILDGIMTSDTGGNGTAQAVDLETGPDQVQIIANEMKNVTSARSAKGVLIGFNGGTDPSQDTLIQSNSIHDITSSTRGAYAVVVSNVNPGTSNLTVTSNTISNLNGGGWVHAIGLEGDAPNVMIMSNDFSNLNSSTADNIAVWFENEDVSFSSGTVNGNNFNVNAPIYGIAVHPALSGSPVDGTCNWWNSSTGPTNPSNSGGTGAQASANVTFSPWLISPGPNALCAANQKDCHDAAEQQEKDFNDQQKADKKAFDATHPTPDQRKAFDNHQKADKAAFQAQYNSEEMQCKQLPKN